MADQLVIREPYDEIQLRLFLIQNYEGNQSAVLVKAHHCMCDAVAVAAMFQIFSDDFDPSDFPAQRSIPFYAWAFIYTFLPFTFLYQGILQFLHIFITKDNNAFNAGRGVYGKKKGAMNLGLDLVQIKDYCKANKITLNHYYLTILSKTIYRYLSLK